MKTTTNQADELDAAEAMPPPNSVCIFSIQFNFNFILPPHAAAAAIH
jgi:hypothetical protein